MSYKEYKVADLATFTGRSASSFQTDYVEGSALPQALLLFKLGTCLASPDDLSDIDKTLVDFAILSMADAIQLSAPFQSAMASPFNSESIGSYSYSKTAQVVVGGLPTGVEWFDIAIAKLSVCLASDGAMGFGGIEAFENDALFTDSTAFDGNARILSPSEVRLSASLGFPPALASIYER